MLRRCLLLTCLTALAALPVAAAEHPVPVGKFGRLDHVFLIMMENETDTDILGNPRPGAKGYDRGAYQQQ